MLSVQNIPKSGFYRDLQFEYFNAGVSDQRIFTGVVDIERTMVVMYYESGVGRAIFKKKYSGSISTRNQKPFLPLLKTEDLTIDMGAPHTINEPVIFGLDWRYVDQTNMTLDVYGDEFFYMALVNVPHLGYEMVTEERWNSTFRDKVTGLVPSL